MGRGPTRLRPLIGAGSGGQRNTSASACDGVLKPRVCRGRSLSSSAMASRSSWVRVRQSSRRGRYWRSRPLVFSLLPRRAGGWSDQRGDRAHVACRKPGRFPSGRAPRGLGFGGSFADVQDPRSTPAAVGQPDTARTTDHPTGAQVSGQLPAQRAAGLHEQGAVDALVGHLHLRVVGIGQPQPALDLLGRPSSPKPLGHDASQHRVRRQLARLRPGRPCPRLLIGSRGPVPTTTTVAGDLTADRRSRPTQPGRDRPQ